MQDWHEWCLIYCQLAVDGKCFTGINAAVTNKAIIINITSQGKFDERL
jgi:hypothetical protein